MLVSDHQLYLLIYKCLNLQIAELHGLSREGLSQLLVVLHLHIQAQSDVVIEHVLQSESIIDKVNTDSDDDGFVKTEFIE